MVMAIKSTFQSSHPPPSPPEQDGIQLTEEDSGFVKNVNKPPASMEKKKCSLGTRTASSIKWPSESVRIQTPDNTPSQPPGNRNDISQFFYALKAENDSLRKGVKDLEKEMSSLCKEMRSKFLAQRTVIQQFAAPSLNMAADTTQNSCPNSLLTRPPPSVKAPISAQTKFYSQMATANTEEPQT